MSQQDESLALSRKTFLVNTWLQVAIVAGPVLYLLMDAKADIAVLKSQVVAISANNEKTAQILDRVDERSRQSAARLEAMKAAGK